MGVKGLGTKCKTSMHLWIGSIGNKETIGILNGFSGLARTVRLVAVRFVPRIRSPGWPIIVPYS